MYDLGHKDCFSQKKSQESQKVENKLLNITMKYVQNVIASVWKHGVDTYSERAVSF